MNYLSKLKDKGLLQGDHASLIAFLLFLFLTAGSHFSYILKAFEAIDIIWFVKAGKIGLFCGLCGYLIYYVKIKKINFKSPYFYCFFIYTLIFLIKLVLYKFSDEFLFENFKFNVNIFISSIVYFVMGIFFRFNLTPIRKKFFTVVVFGLLLFDLQYFSSIGLGLALLKDKSLVGSYLMWGDTFALLCLVLLANSSNRYRLVVMFFGLFGVGYLLSRASFLSYFAAVFSIELSRRSIKRNILYVGGVVLALIFAIFLMNIFDLHIKSLRFNLSNNNSLTSRIETFKLGWHSISASWFMGDFLGQLKNVDPFGTLGHYMHNYLSIWRQFGLIAFCCFLFYYQAILRLIFDNKNSVYLGLFVFLVVESSLFRSYSFPAFWMAAGVVAQKGILKNRE